MITETTEQYRDRPAAHAGMLWNIVKECPAFAWAWSALNPNRLPMMQARELNIGTAAHLAVLEPHLFEERVIIVPFDDYRKRDAQIMRDEAYSQGCVPLLTSQLELIDRLRQVIMGSDVGKWFAEGKCEQSIVWEEEEGGISIPCKARIDCVCSPAALLVDLKTAGTASPEMFQRAAIRDGHHLRAAWYRLGWMAYTGEARDYVFVVVSKSEPHLVQCYRLDDRAIAWGERLCRRALAEVRLGLESGHWRGYDAGGEKINTISLPAFAEFRLAEMFAEEDAA